MKFLIAIFSIFLLTACERAQNKGYEGPNFVEKAITAKKLEIFRHHLESIEVTQEQIVAIAHKELNSKIDGVTLDKENVSDPVYLMASNDSDHDYNMTEFVPIDGARRHLFSKQRIGRDYNIFNSSPKFSERKEADAIIAACMLAQRIELNKLVEKYPKIIVLIENKEIMVTNFPTDKIKEWEEPDTKMESAEIVPAYHHNNATFHNVLFISVSTMWIDGYGYSQKQTEKEFCHGMVTKDMLSKEIQKALEDTVSKITLDLSPEQLMELQK